MGPTHLLMKRLKNLRTEMALSVLAYNLARAMNIVGIRPLLQAMGHSSPLLLPTPCAIAPIRAPQRSE